MTNQAKRAIAEAAQQMLQGTLSYDAWEALSSLSALTQVIFVCFDREVFEVYRQRLG